MTDNGANAIRKRLLYALTVGVLLGALVSSPLAAWFDEEAYLRGIRPLLVEAEAHLFAATQALSQCLGAFSECITNRTPVIEMLGESRSGLLRVRAAFASLLVPERYQSANALVIEGLTDSADGLLLQMEGLDEPSLGKFEAGSDLMATGRQNLNDAVDLVSSLPPRSGLGAILLAVAIGLAAFIASSVFLFRRQSGKLLRSSPRTVRSREGP